MTPARMLEIAEPILKAKGWDNVTLITPERVYGTEKEYAGVHARLNGTCRECFNGAYTAALSEYSEGQVADMFDEMPEAFPDVAIVLKDRDRVREYNRGEKPAKNVWAFTISENPHGIRLDEIRLADSFAEEQDVQKLRDDWFTRLKPGGKVIGHGGEVINPATWRTPQ